MAFFPLPFVKSLKGPKLCKTVEEQKQVAIEREKKTMENCQSWKRLSSDKDVANYDEGKNISLQSLEGTSKPRAASRSVSFLLPNLPTTKMVKLLKQFSENFHSIKRNLVTIGATRYGDNRERN